MNEFLDNNVKLKLTKDIDAKIRYLCDKINHVEWSGLLIYKPVYVDDKLHHLEAFDIIPMNMGNVAYTEFRINEPKRDSSGYEDKMIDYIMSHDEAVKENWKMGLIHSHNNMATFFSGTDIKELHDNCKFHNFYVSLIVNNKHNMCCKIAFYTDDEKNISIERYIKNEHGEKIYYSTTDNVVNEHSILEFDTEIEFENGSVEDVIDEVFIKSVENIIEAAEIKRNRYTSFNNRNHINEDYYSFHKTFGNHWDNNWDWSHNDAPYDVLNVDSLYRKIKNSFYLKKSEIDYLLNLMDNATIKNDEFEVLDEFEELDDITPIDMGEVEVCIRNLYEKVYGNRLTSFDKINYIVKELIELCDGKTDEFTKNEIEDLCLDLRNEYVIEDNISIDVNINQNILLSVSFSYYDNKFIQDILTKMI